MLVAIEGLDGSGKTTVANLLAKHINARYLALPPESMKLTSSTLLEKHDSLARYLYYLASVAVLADAADADGVVVADRFVASAHALHLHVLGEVARGLRALELPRADLTLYLDVSETERRVRLQARGTPLDPFERYLEADAAFRQRVAEKLRSYPHTHIIDTTGLSPDAVARRGRVVWEACPGARSA